MKYAATMNVPGYLPWSDDVPPVFDTAGEAWAYLADERREQEDAEWDSRTDDSEISENYSETVDALDAYASANFGDGTVYGYTPGITGSDGMNDQGIAYCVTEVDE